MLFVICLYATLYIYADHRFSRIHTRHDRFAVMHDARKVF